jgi:hypothetical protein
MSSETYVQFVNKNLKQFTDSQSNEYPRSDSGGRRQMPAPESQTFHFTPKRVDIVPANRNRNDIRIASSRPSQETQHLDSLHKATAKSEEYDL